MLRLLRKPEFAVAAASLGLLFMGFLDYFPSASNKGYFPEQPIPFSHQLHAGQYKMECLYCHSSAEYSKHSSVPPLNVCMNCHTVVKTDSPYIQTLKKHYDSGKPVEWVRIHELPDFAYFPHKRHIAAGLQCQVCHGPVETMARVEQFAPLTMGWCMECHRGQTTPLDVMAKFYPDKPAGHRGPVAPVNCSTCHH
jgi:hypothetical protein